MRKKREPKPRNPMMVIAKDTDEKIEKTAAYKAPDNKYYSSENGYLEVKTQNEYYLKCKDWFMDMMEYPEYPSVLTKKLNGYKKFGYDVLYFTLIDCESAVIWALKNKTFSGEYNRLSYVFAIIENKIMIHYNKKKNSREVERLQDNKIKEMEDIEMKPISAKQGNDVSSLLGDAEWM